MGQKLKVEYKKYKDDLDYLNDVLQPRYKKQIFELNEETQNLEDKVAVMNEIYKDEHERFTNYDK